MKKILPLIAIALLVAFTTCRKEHNTNTEGTKVTEMIQAQTNALNILYTYGEEHAENDPAVAMAATAAILQTTEGIAHVEIYDSTNMLIALTNGLNFGISIDYTNANGMSLTRGGGKGGNLKSLMRTQVLQKMKNKNILFYCPPVTDFYKDAELQNLQTIVSGSNAGVTLTSLTGIDCSLTTPGQFKNYGLVLMSTHGQPYGFMVRLISYFDENKFVTDSVKPDGTVVVYTTNKAKTENDVKTLLNNYDPALYDMIESGKLVIDITLRFEQPAVQWYRKLLRATSVVPLYATSKYLAQQSKFDSTVVLGNFCYSGARNNNAPDQFGLLNIADAMLTQVPGGSYYGWVLAGNNSAQVENEDSKSAEKQFLHNLLYDLDSTGAAADSAGQTIKGRAMRNGVLSGQILNLTLFGNDNLGYGCGAGTFTDPRDGYTYKTVCIKGVEWFAENLRYNSPGSECYDLDPANCAIYGRLYTWTDLMNGTTSQGLCPAGWHVSTSDEWQQLADSLGGINAAGGVLKSVTGWNAPNTGATNGVGFSALPGGRKWGPPGYETCSDKGDFGFWWTSTINASDTTNRNMAAMVRHAAILGLTSYGPVWERVSCRCVKDH